MKRDLNPNAGEFHPTGGRLTPKASLNEGGSRSSSLQGGSAPAAASSSQQNNANPNDRTPFQVSEGLVEACYFVPATRFLMDCRAAFYEHPETTKCKHMEFERLLRRCFFGAHDANELSISLASTSGQNRPFWVSYSTAYFRMAHDVVQEVELGTPCPSTQLLPPAAAGASPAMPMIPPNLTSFTNNSTEEEKQRESLREVYLSRLRPVVPYSIRKQLAFRAKRPGVDLQEDVTRAMTYALDIFFFFTRLQFLRFLDASSGLSYSACVQFLTRLRERLMKPEVADSFLSVALVLMLVSTAHITFAPRAVEVALNETNSSKLKAQWLFCKYFSALVVAFLSGSSLQSVEELRHSFVSTKQDDSLPVLRACPGALAAIREVISYNNKTAMLWSITLSEAVKFALRHLGQTDRTKRPNRTVPFFLSESTTLDDHLHVKFPTVLAALLGSTNTVAEEKESQHVTQQKGGVSSRSKEFHALATKAASTSGGSEYETVYFSLLALTNMGCFSPTGLSWLFRALEDSYNSDSHPSALDAFLSSTVCATVSPTARELLDVLRTLMRVGHKPLQLQALIEFKGILERQQNALPSDGTPTKQPTKP
ncbi:hypothetical protein C3747_130g27 [Trypanosoma cruzi]|uniref:Uncharacterized protein n=2 Tax=Trypanosoma cruzi TaxID=5693 RepID=A0A2V2WB76_TRYCR|nr:hypothetical protein TcYC6_0089110 [Trypanosoma cruzi]PWV05472.1 hypothetical protein C3747_130g27 [Trypanosoma cruzi]